MDKKTMLLSVVILLLFLLVSCKQQEQSSTETTEEGQQTDDLFDSVLDGTETMTSISEETTSDDTEEEEETLEETSDETTDESEKYAAPSCGDNICTYYETFSSCPDDCEKLVETTLNDYPEFLDEPLLVVGDDASSTDVITATVISTYLVTHDITSETKLASEVTDFTSNDLILIGSPCDNQAIATLLHYDASTCGNIISGMNNAVIKLLVSDTNKIVIITGYDKGDTKDASKMLTTDGAYNLNGAEEWVNLDSDGNINVYFSKN